MESIKTKRKGLTSLVLLLISVAMLATSTFAWFTDTATVKGSTINAGNLKIDLYAGDDRLKQQWITETNPTGDDSAINTAWVSAKSGWITTKGYQQIPSTDIDNSKLPSGVTELYKVTGKDLAVINISNVEPGQAIAVKNVGIINTGELAVSYTAGFAIDESKTGLDTLYTSGENLLNPEKKASLLAKQAAKNSDGTLKSAWGDSYIPADDLGKKLEDVLVVYSWDGTSKADTIVKYKNELGVQDEKGTILDTSVSNYLGTIPQLIHANDAAYMQGLLDTTGKDADKIAADQAEYDELVAIQSKIKSAAAGYCLPLSAMATETATGKYNDKKDVTVYKYEGETTSPTTQHSNVGPMGELNFLIVMPKLAGNEYQNASLKLSIGATATQVEFEHDGTGYAFYDR